MSKSQRLKGANFERAVCDLLSAGLGKPIRRNIGQSRDGGDDITVGRVRVECKKRARIAVYEWIEQVERACSDGEVGVVVFAADRRQPYAIVPVAQLIELLRLEAERAA